MYNINMCSYVAMDKYMYVYNYMQLLLATLMLYIATVAVTN